MMGSLPKPFPALCSIAEEDHNPAIRLFGKRFISEQSMLELLSEFLAVVLHEKQIAGEGCITKPLPGFAELKAWPETAPLLYNPPVRINLKLFALLGLSRLDTRHDVHYEHHATITKRLRDSIDAGNGDADDVVEWFEDLLGGFRGAGFNRTWCAQTFVPVSKGLIGQETLWNETVARREPVRDWYEAVENFRRYFSVSRHRFLARGGELLYLQICNALRTSSQKIQSFVSDMCTSEPGCLALLEQDPVQLHGLLQRGLADIQGPYTRGLDLLIDAIEDLDPYTAQTVNRTSSGAPSWVECEWCPEESWPEGYLFAVELSRVLRAALDPVERLEMLITGCALQVLRSLSAQSARYADIPRAPGPLGYAWLLAPPTGDHRPLRRASQRNLQVVQGQIQNALRTEALQENAARGPRPADRLYREADTRYGHKLFLSLGKKMGFIVPKTGPGARFVMTDDILRYLVLALLRPGERCTYDRFLERMHLHYGMAIEGEHLAEAAEWSGLPASRSIQPGGEGWLTTTLRAGGFLAELSDACSVVRNTYAPAGDDGREA